VKQEARTSTHIPVLLREVVEALRVHVGGHYIDCTVGGGGHAAAILEKSSPAGKLLGIDADPKAIEVARGRLERYGRAVTLVNENFDHLEEICSRLGFRPVHGILFDLGMSSLQLENASRGFSFQLESPLDMRFSPSQELTAAEIVNSLPEEELAYLIERYGEERRSRRIARYIVQNRPLNTTLELARVVEMAVGKRDRIHPATKTFQALRLAVNQELEHLEAALIQAVNLLSFGGRLVVISYHSLEDRLVKEFLRQESQGCLCPRGVPTCTCGYTPTLKVITKKVVTPSRAEVESNPRSRSARMRVAEKI